MFASLDFGLPFAFGNCCRQDQVQHNWWGKPRDFCRIALIFPLDTLEHQLCGRTIQYTDGVFENSQTSCHVGFEYPGQGNLGPLPTSLDHCDFRGTWFHPYGKEQS